MPKKRDKTRPRPANLSPEEHARRDRIRESVNRWRNAPPGMSPAMADAFKTRIKAGKTIRDLTSPPAGGLPMVSTGRFRKHCELNPEWGAEVRKLSWANFAKKSRASSWRAAATKVICTKGLHRMEGDNVMITHQGRRRHCLACWRQRAKNPPIHSIIPVLDLIKEKLRSGKSIGEIMHGKPTGGGKIDRSLILAQPNVFSHFRRLNPDFDQFVREHTRDSNAVGQQIRWKRVFTQRRTQAARDERNDYQKIRDLIPAGNPHRDDIVARIFEDILSGALKREDAPARAKVYVKEMNDLFPTKYRKFGDAPLYSLDAPVYEDGSATRGDMVSDNLWS
jgi:hypothetical protein